MARIARAENSPSLTLQRNYVHPSCGHFAAPCPSERQDYQRSQYITQDDTQQVYFAEETVRPSHLERSKLLPAQMSRNDVNKLQGMRGSGSSLTGALGNGMNAFEGHATASEYRRQSAHSTAFIPMNNSPQFIYNSPHTSTSPHSIQNFPHEHQEYSSAWGGSPDVGSETKYIKAETPASYSAHVHNDKVKPERKRTGSPSSSLTGALGGQEAALTNAFRVPSKHTSRLLELVPQPKYTAPSTLTFQKPEILFDIPGLCGISLESASKSQVPPEWKTERVECFALATKVTIRINWPGYLASSCAINVCDDTKDRRPNTKAKLASNISKAVRRVLEEHSRKIQSEKGFEKWVISKDGSTGIQFSMVYLTKLRHVSEGSWQPELYVAWNLNNEA